MIYSEKDFKISLVPGLTTRRAITGPDGRTQYCNSGDEPSLINRMIVAANMASREA